MNWTLRTSLPPTLLLLLAVFVVIIVVSGCDTQIESGGEAVSEGDLIPGRTHTFADPTLLRSAQEITRPRSTDELYAAVNALVHGFGGFAFIEDGSVEVWMKPGPGGGVPEADTVELALLRALETLDNVDHVLLKLEDAVVRIKEAEYSAIDLLNWRAAIAESGVSGLLRLDFDESQNRIVLGVGAGTDGDAVEAALEQIGVPVGAVIIEETEPAVSYGASSNSNAAPSKLTSLFPYKVGGIMFTRRDPGGYLQGCTIGFNVDVGLVKGYVTNSHCTQPTGLEGEQGANYYQPTYSNLTFIGTEYKDGHTFTSTGPFSSCPQGAKCRYSDAAIIRYEGYVNYYLGRIARTEDFSYAGSYETDVDQSQPYFHITGEVPFPNRYDLVDKVGHVTGWTRGNVVDTCVDHLSDRGVWLLCQDDVQTSFQQAEPVIGDSGAPAFKPVGVQPPEGPSSVTLVGVLWGGSPGSGRFYISSMENIRDDLGSFVTH